MFIRGEGAEELAIHLIAGISGGLSLGTRTPPGFHAREAADAVFAAMGPLERALVAGCVLDADISSGGHEQLMFNPSGDLAEWWDRLDDLDRRWWSLERIEDRLGPALAAAGAYERWAEHPGG